MRTIGGIEKLLVGGIVIVIGAILAVAIKGAGDFDAQREKQLAAAAKGGDKTNRGKSDSSRDVGGRSGGGKKDAAAKSPTVKAAPGDRDGGRRPANASPVLRTDVPVAPQGGGDTSGRHGTGRGDEGRESPVHADLNGTDAGAGRLAEGPGLTPKPPVGAAGDPSPAPDAATRGNGAVDTSTGNPSIDDLLKRQRDALAAGGKPIVKPVALDEIGDDAVVVPDVADAPVTSTQPGDATQVAGPQAASESWTYQVRSGDSLERIARALYGEGGEYQAILAANPKLADKNTIRVGQTLALPKKPTQSLELATKGLVAAADAPPTATKPAKVEAKEPLDGGGSTPKTSGFKRLTATENHVVASGDTLMSIALEHYGTKAAWRLIYDANVATIPDKDRIKVGARFKLPAQ
jgi:nucleoid-associated protein YgaU